MAGPPAVEHAYGMLLLPHLRQAIRWAVARTRISSELGASAVEYAIMVTLIAVVILLSVVFLGQRTSGSFSCTGSAVSAKSTVAGCG
jgi:Flp pilus assembly pilin Flp